MIDIYSKADYPSCELSNFAAHPFELDGIHIASMEGFLQSLKYMMVEKQKSVCCLSGEDARKAGKRKVLWKMTQTVYWRGKDIDLMSDELQMLLDRAYDAMYEQSVEFRKALLDSGNEMLGHSIGKKQMDRTILTEYHFVRRLEKLRARALEEYGYKDRKVENKI